eukprot:116518-Chlamydomonas_euryale.AAC.3
MPQEPDGKIGKSARRIWRHDIRLMPTDSTSLRRILQAHLTGASYKASLIACVDRSVALHAHAATFAGLQQVNGNFLERGAAKPMTSHISQLHIMSGVGAGQLHTRISAWYGLQGG